MKSIDRLKQRIFKRPDAPPVQPRLRLPQPDPFDRMVAIAKEKDALISYTVIHLKDLL